jgi:Flp pilus assembly protein TadD
MELARNARNLAPEDPRVAHTLGRLAFASGEFAWALSLLQESDRRLPRQPEVLHDLAWSSCSVGRMREADEAMRSALEIEANFPRAEAARRFVKAMSLYLNPEAARSAPGEVQALLREDPACLPAMAAEGLLRQERSEVAAARQSFEQILQRYSAFAPAHKQLAALYILPPADLQKAYEHATRAREAFPRDSEVARSLGIVSYQRKEHARAAALLRESAAERPSDGELLAYLGMAQFELKQNTEARQTLQRARTLDLLPALASEVDRVLSELQ